MKFLINLLILLLVSSCYVEKRKPTGKNPKDHQVAEFVDKFLSLEGTIAMVNNFIAGDFSDCETSLPPFETKICRISQTASSEQMVRITGQLNYVVKEMQDSLYGVDCINDTDAGCPASGSIAEQIATFDPNDIVNIQNDIAALQNFQATIEGRLNNFDGSGQSIETVISGLDARIDDLEQVINGQDYYQWIFLCNDVTNFHEPVLRTGDKSAVRFYNSNTNNGMAQITAGVDGSFYGETSVKPTCQVKFYDLTTEYKICWNNTNRNASESSIDTECDSANNFANPTADCTCE